MDLKSVLSRDTVALHLQGQDKEGIIDELLKVAARTGKISDASAARKAVLDRESHPPTRVLRAVWRQRMVPDAGAIEVVELLEPGALAPYHDLRFELVPCLPPARIRELVPGFDRQRIPSWLAQHLRPVAIVDIELTADVLD